MSNDFKSTVRTYWLLVSGLVLILRITGVTHQSWWLATAPIWAPMAFLTVTALAVVLFAIIASIFDNQD